MTILYFIGALIVLFLIAIVTNRITGTKAHYIDALRLEADESILWRDDEADFAVLPKLRAQHISYWRLRKHTAVWTGRRLIIARKALFQSKRMITHVVHLREGTTVEASANEAAQGFSGGFFGRGYVTLIGAEATFTEVNQKSCLVLQPTETSTSASGISEAFLFSDKLTELEADMSR